MDELFFEEIGELFQSDNDPDGSYTGTGTNEYDDPVQDADDL